MGKVTQEKYPHMAYPLSPSRPQPSSLSNVCFGRLFNSGPEYQMCLCGNLTGFFRAQEPSMAPPTELPWPLEKNEVGQEAPRAMVWNIPQSGLQWGLLKASTLGDILRVSQGRKSLVLECPCHFSLSQQQAASSASARPQ